MVELSVPKSSSLSGGEAIRTSDVGQMKEPRTTLPSTWTTLHPRIRVKMAAALRTSRP